MRDDTEHEAYAHYEVRNHRYKLIYWYNDDLLVGGALPGGEDCREWELFDCQKDRSSCSIVMWIRSMGKS
ncbi:hypothetical protein N7524_008892 [Penicillium chrysogenum]|nr:hypothetical protein N7524_008892 [Penicillium chrysogenum]